MWTRYVLVVFAVFHSVLSFNIRSTNPWVSHFSKLPWRKCIPRTALATCILIPDPTAPFKVTGVVDFEQVDHCGFYTNLYITLNIKGFPANATVPERKRGFHVHQFGDLSAGCTSAGGHYNPFNETHGGPHDKIRHVGDLGNIVVSPDGTVKYKRQDSVANLFGRHSIIGRAVVVHAGTDDLGRGGDAESKKTGNAGSRLSCCVIGRKTI